MVLSSAMSFTSAALMGVWIVTAILFCTMTYIFAGLRQVQQQLSLRSAGGNDSRQVGPQPSYDLTPLKDIWPEELDWNQRQILLFVQPTCLTCNEIIAGLNELPEALKEVTVIVSGSTSLVGQSHVQEVLDQHLLFQALDIRVTPLFLQIDNGKVLQVGTAGNKAGAQRVLRRMLNEEASRS